MILLSPRKNIESQNEIKDRFNPRTTTKITTERFFKLEVATQESNKDSETTTIEKNIDKIKC